MKYGIFSLVLLSVPVIGMHKQPVSSIWETKMEAHRARFFERLPHFNTLKECDDQMTTESEADEEFEQGLITQQELTQWRVKRAQAREEHNQQIKACPKNAYVEAVLNKVAPEDKQELYRNLHSLKNKNVPTEQSLKALGYEADAE